MSELAMALQRYGERLHDAVGDGHHVVSPLGAWLLLALRGAAATGGTAEELAEELGMPLAEATAAADHLLEDAHPVVAASVAAWTDPRVRTPALTAWLDGMVPTVNRGPIPNQTEADAWANERTLGLIPRFPLEISPDLLLILATAVATKVSWRDPFDVVPADHLGSTSPWSTRLACVLERPGTFYGWRHRRAIVDTARAGRVAFHAESATDGLLVGSIIAEDPTAKPADVLAAGTGLVTDQAARQTVDAVSLFDLPLGDGDVWSVAEEPVQTTNPTGREERAVAVLPAWSARTTVRLLGNPGLGYVSAAAALEAAMGAGPLPWTALQSAVARYSAEGFEAAAITAMTPVSRRRHPPGPGRRRTVTLRFGRPHAVVAAVGTRLDHLPGAAWSGLPVFSAWVTEPEEA